MQIDVSVLVWTIINFSVLMLLLGRFLFRPLIAHMKQRDAHVRQGMDAGAESRSRLENAGLAHKTEQDDRIRAAQKALQDQLREQADDGRRRLEAGDMALRTRREEAMAAFQQEHENLVRALSADIPQTMEAINRKLERAGAESD